jgi:orotidine-5'-phosphate decarboxylase
MGSPSRPRTYPEAVTGGLGEPEGAAEGFAARFARLRAVHGPLVFGLDPSGRLLEEWGLGDTAHGLEGFVDVVVDAATGSVAVVKPQSAFYERHGWQGIRALTRLVEACRAAGVLVLLDVKRGDVGSTNDAYAEAYLGKGAPIAVDALTVTPYLGFAALRSVFERAARAGAATFVVTRSSNPEGRPLQAAHVPDGRSVEQHLLSEIEIENMRLSCDDVGPVGAVIGPGHGAIDDVDLRESRALFLAPGIGAQGAGVDDVVTCFAACPERVLPSASRSLLAEGPSVPRLKHAIRELNESLLSALG